MPLTKYHGAVISAYIVTISLLVTIIVLVIVCDHATMGVEVPTPVNAILVNIGRQRYPYQIKMIRKNMAWITDIYIMDYTSTITVTDDERTHIVHVPDTFVDYEQAAIDARKYTNETYLCFGDQVFPFEKISTHQLISYKGAFRFFGGNIIGTETSLDLYDETLAPFVLYEGDESSRDYLMRLHFEDRLRYVPKMNFNVYITSDTEANRIQFENITLKKTRRLYFVSFHDTFSHNSELLNFLETLT